jgi:hypothetical protein
VEVIGVLKCESKDPDIKEAQSHWSNVEKKVNIGPVLKRKSGHNDYRGTGG